MGVDAWDGVRVSLVVWDLGFVDRFGCCAARSLFSGVCICTMCTSKLGIGNCSFPFGNGKSRNRDAASESTSKPISNGWSRTAAEGALRE